MNISYGLTDQLIPITSTTGITLSIPERLKLETSLDQLQQEIKCDEIYFWGKILGTEKDYYIALAVYFKNHKYFPSKRFYFSQSTTFTFSELPSIHNHHLPFFAKHNTYFIGNPDIILEKFASKEKNLTEGDRLSYVVRKIDSETSLLPVGSVKLLPNKELRLNDNFEGLTKEEIMDMKSFCLFRKIRTKEKYERVITGNVVFDFNFMDSVDNEVYWSKQIDEGTGMVVNIRSLVWPGYYFYHIANTKQYGGMYYGYGIKNEDIEFLLG